MEPIRIVRRADRAARPRIAADQRRYVEFPQSGTPDVSDSADGRRLVSTVVRRHGGLHVAVNSAAVLGTGTVAGFDEDTWTAMVGTNLTGTLLSMKPEIVHMREHGGGVIVNMAAFGVTAVPGLGPYGATKAGVVALTKAAAREAIATGVRNNTVSPGPTATDMSRRSGETDADRATRLAKRIQRAASAKSTRSLRRCCGWPRSSRGFVSATTFVDGGTTA